MQKDFRGLKDCKRLAWLSSHSPGVALTCKMSSDVQGEGRSAVVD